MEALQLDGNRSAKGKANRGRERLYFSPYCKRERSLFDGPENREVSHD